MRFTVQDNDLVIPGTNIRMRARAIESRPTRDTGAWIGEVMTVQLDGFLDVIRRADRPGGVLGDWFALGDAPASSWSFAQRHAIPPRGNAKLPRLEHRMTWRLLPGTILNVGRCAPLFQMTGLGYQAEFLEGPLPAAVRT
jgi:hypothetical protein